MGHMTPITITFALLIFAIVMFVWEKIPLAVTSMIVCIALVLTKVLTIKQAFEGFVDSNVILFVAMFIVGGAFLKQAWPVKWAGW
jgi:di/tricarboxylate transporter